MANRSRGVSTLHRHLQILDVFHPLRPERTLSQLATESGLALSTTHRLVAELVEEGLLERLPDRRIRLGVRLWELAARTPSTVGLREAARPWALAAHARIRQHVQVCVLAETDALCLERFTAPGSVVNATVIGGRIPASQSSSGLVLLADAAPAIIATVIAEGFEMATPHGIRNEHMLLDAIAEVKTLGYAITEGFIHVDATGIAVPIRSGNGHVAAALSAVVPVSTVVKMPIVEALQVAATGIGRALVERESGAGGARRYDAAVSAESWQIIADLDRRRPPRS